jgi:hypothetical protein
LKEQRRLKNERKYKNWEELSTGGRRYWYDIVGRLGWISRYVKVVDDNENTISFYQEVYDENSKLIELHHKYPEDKGHQKV